MTYRITKQMIKVIDDLVELGMSIREISAVLQISDNTIKAHKSSSKGIRDDLALAKYLYEKNDGIEEMVKNRPKRKVPKKDTAYSSPRLYLMDRGMDTEPIEAMKNLMDYNIPDPVKYYRDWRQQYVCG